MTCQRVAWVHPTCTCGALLQLGVDHGDDELGNPLCPTCSGCGCEPNERNLMNEQELDALPDGAVVLDVEDDAWQKLSGRWRSIVTSQAIPSIDLVNDRLIAPVTLLRPVPEPDHSMCARHDPSLRHAIQEAIGEASVCWDNMSGAGVFDVARANAVADRLCAILDIPEPEPTVVERAAEILSVQDTYVSTPLDVAQALADAGLLVRDGEQ